MLRMEANAYIALDWDVTFVCRWNRTQLSTTQMIQLPIPAIIAFLVRHWIDLPPVVPAGMLQISIPFKRGELKCRTSNTTRKLQQKEEEYKEEQQLL